jgi:hypothetical protein
MKNLTVLLALFLTGCWNGEHYVEEHKQFRIDSVAYFPIGVPSVHNLDPRWVAYTKYGTFTYRRPVEVGDSVEVIIMHRDTVQFDPIIEHSEIKK